jgi:hypothetical protein
MGRKCGICYHSERDAIEKALQEKVPLREIAGRYGTTRSALQRHAQHIIEQAAAGAPAVVLPETKPATFIEEMDRLKATALKWLALAEKAENSAAAVTWHRALRETLELYFKIGVEQMRAAAESAEPKEPTAETVDADTYAFTASEIGKRKYPDLEKDLADFNTARLIALLEKGNGHAQAVRLQAVADASEINVSNGFQPALPADNDLSMEGDTL